MLKQNITVFNLDMGESRYGLPKQVSQTLHLQRDFIIREVIVWVRIQLEGTQCVIQSSSPPNNHFTSIYLFYLHIPWQPISVNCTSHISKMSLINIVALFHIYMFSTTVSVSDNTQIDDQKLVIGGTFSINQLPASSINALPSCLASSINNSKYRSVLASTPGSIVIVPQVGNHCPRASSTGA